MLKSPFITPEQEAANENTPLTRLEELATSKELARIVALNPTASPLILRELSSRSDRITLKNLASNPNTPTDILFKLGIDFPEQLLENPIFPLLILENPNLLADMPIATLRSLLKQENVPETFLIWAVENSRDSSVLLAVAINPAIPKTILEKLTQTRFADVAEAAKLHVNFAGEMSEGWREAALNAMHHTKLSHDWEHERKLWNYGLISEDFVSTLDFRSDIARNSDISTKVLLLLANDRDEYTRKLLAKRLKTPTSALEILLEDNDAEVREHIINHPHISLKALQARFQQEAANLNKKPASLNLPEKLKGDENIYVRRSLAENLHIPITLMEQLAEDEDFYVRRSLANNPHIPITLMEQLAENEEVDIRRSLAENPHIPITLMEQLAEDEDVYVRYAVARNISIPINILEKLILKIRNKGLGDSAIKNLRNQVLQNPDISVDTLQKLALVKDWRSRLAIARHPNADATLLNELAKTNQWQVRLVVVKHPNTPIELLEYLAKDKALVVQQLALTTLYNLNFQAKEGIFSEFIATKNPNTSQDILKSLSKSPWISIRIGVARHPNTPVDVLEQLAKDRKYQVRSKVAQNSNTPVKILEKLLKDEDIQVRLIAGNNPNTPIASLEKLTQSNKNPLIKETAIKNLINRSPKHALVYLKKYLKPNQPSFTRLLIFLHPQAPTTQLAKNYRSSSWLERYAIAINPNTPTNIREHLAQDANRIVRAAAKANARILNILITSPSFNYEK